MIVAARQGNGEGGFLGMLPIQRVGDWSYSIYLWHWPIWVFALSWLSLRGYGVDATQKTLMVLASLALGAVSYRYVEQPVRIRRDIWTPRRLMVSSGVVFSLMLGFTILAFLNTGFPNRLPEYLLPAELARRTGTPRDECFRNSNSIKKATETYCSFGGEEVAGQAFGNLVGRFVCQSVPRATFFGCARERNTRADRNAERLQGLHRRFRREPRGSTAVLGVQPRDPGLRARPRRAEHHRARKQLGKRDRDFGAGRPSAFFGQDRCPNHAVAERRIRRAAAMDRESAQGGQCHQ